MMKIILIAAAAIFMVALLYFFAIMPMRPRNGLISRFKNQLYAHRGLHNIKEGIPENSISAICNAVAHGYGVELDVQITKDEQVIVFHDDLLSRACGIDLAVRQKTYSELCRLNLFQTSEKIPLLTDILEIVAGKVPLLIELKIALHSTRTCVLVNEILKDYAGAYCIESFNTLALHWYRKYRPDIIRGQLSSNLTKTNKSSYILSFITKHLLSNFYGKPDFIAYCYTDTKNIGLWLNKHIFKATIFAWTISDKANFEYAHRYFDSFIFEGFMPDTYKTPENS